MLNQSVMRKIHFLKRSNDVTVIFREKDNTSLRRKKDIKIGRK